jgi:nucleotide-binding universal stress UspA family protein
MIENLRKRRSVRILLALDGSETAAAVIPSANAVARQLDGILEAVHVGPVKRAAPELRSRLGLDQADDVSLSVLVGDPVEELLKAARGRGVVLVILATHGHNLERQGRMGSIPTALAARATRPILLIRPEAGPVSDPLNRILFPFDGASNTANALIPAVRLAGRLGASIDVLFLAYKQREPANGPGIVRPPRYTDHPYYDWPNWCTDVAERCPSCAAAAAQGIRTNIHVRTVLGNDDVGGAIGEFAEEQKEDALVLVRRTHLEPGLSPIVRTVLDLAPCPVLLVPGRSAVANHWAQNHERKRETVKCFLGWRNWE